MDMTFLDSRRARAVLTALRMGLGLLFVYASLDKIWEPGAFAEAIYNYRLLPDVFLHGAAILLPWVELVTGLLLVLNRFPRTSSLLAGSMLLVFTLAVASALARGLNFNCGCFNLDSETGNIGLRKILENVGLLLVATVLWWRSPAPLGKSEPTA